MKDKKYNTQDAVKQFEGEVKDLPMNQWAVAFIGWVVTEFDTGDFGDDKSYTTKVLKDKFKQISTNDYL